MPSDGFEPRHVTGRIDIWTEMCDRRKCNDTFRSIPSSVLLTAATAGAHPLSDRSGSCHILLVFLIPDEEKEKPGKVGQVVEIERGSEKHIKLIHAK